MMQTLFEALLALDLKPNTVVFFDRDAIAVESLEEVGLDLPFSVTCVPVCVPRGKTLKDCITVQETAEGNYLVNDNAMAMEKAING